MIECYEGRIGGGKSYSAVERMLECLSNNGIIATNVDLVWSHQCFSGNAMLPDGGRAPFPPKPFRRRFVGVESGCKAYCRNRFGMELDDGQLIVLENEQCARFWEHVPNGTPTRPILIVLDESDVWVGNMTTGVKVAPELFTFLKQSRKMCNDIIFITQAVKNLSSQVARLVQYVWRFRDMRRFKLPMVGAVYPWPHILQVQLDYTGEELGSTLRRLDPRIFACYKTTALYSVFKRLEAFDGKKVQARRVRVLRWYEVPPPLWVVIVVALFVVYVAVFL